MRKLKLQMQVTADGYVAGPQGQLDWMTFNMDAPLLAFINELTDNSDTILLGRKMTQGFITYWESLVVNPVAIGEGLRVFSTRKALKLHRSIAYSCGIVVNTYRQG